MFISRFLRMRMFVVVGLALIFAVIAYGFAAANTVPSSNAGDGNNTISGYVITNVHYNLNAADPSRIDSVTFTISPSIPAGGTVAAKLVSSSTTYYTCTVSGGTAVSCATPGATALSADELRVIAAQ